MCMFKWRRLQKEEGEQVAAQPLHYQWFTTLHLHPALFLTCSRCRFFSPWLLFSTGSGVLRMNVNIHQVRARLDYLLHTRLWGPRVMLTDEPRLPSQCRRDCLFLLFHSRTEWAKSLYRDSSGLNVLDGDWGKFQNTLLWGSFCHDSENRFWGENLCLPQIVPGRF